MSGEYSQQLLDIALAVFPTDEKIASGPGSAPYIIPSGSSTPILGSASVVKHLARTKGQLSATTPEESAQVDQWLALSGKLAQQLATADEAASLAKLGDLNEAFVSSTFVAGNKMTIADLALATAIAPVFKRLTAAQRFQFNRVSRHYDLVQHVLHEQLAPAASAKLPHPLIDIDLNRPKTEMKREKKEKKEETAPVAAAAVPAVAATAAAGAAKNVAEAKAPNKQPATEGEKAEKKGWVKPPKEGKPAKGASGGDDGKQQPPAAAPVDDKPDPSKIDFRVGLILSAEKHPNADSLYVEQIDVGEEKPRTVCSGLVAYIPTAEELVGKRVIVIANLKPAKMRGVESQAMLLAAEADGKVELVIAPEGCKPGDRVTVDGYDGAPDAQLNPKQKRWELVQPNLSTNASRQAIFLDPNEGGKEKLFKTDKGPLTVATLVGAKLR